MKHNENAHPDLSGDFPIVPRPKPQQQAAAYPPREGCDGVPEEREPRKWSRLGGAAFTILLAGAVLLLLWALCTWAGMGEGR